MDLSELNFDERGLIPVVVQEADTEGDVTDLESISSQARTVVE